MKRIFTSIGLLLAATLTLSACGSDSTEGEGTTSDSSSSAGSHNQQDVDFAQGMIPHHEQAIEMAQMAQEQTTSPEVKQLAEQIEAAQGPEIETLTGWLKTWGEDAPSAEGDDMGGMDHGDMDRGEGGMMSDEQMKQLAQAQGAAFDRMWLEGMIAHHEGAVEMADKEIADGQNAEAIAMAEEIKATQSTEIKTMQDLLRP